MPPSLICPSKSTEYSVEATDLVADLPMVDHYDDDMMNYDILVGVSELG